MTNGSRMYVSARRKTKTTASKSCHQTVLASARMARRRIDTSLDQRACPSEVEAVSELEVDERVTGLNTPQEPGYDERRDYRLPGWRR